MELHFTSQQFNILKIPVTIIFEPTHEKTNKLGFRHGPTQTGMYSHRKKARSLKLWVKVEDEFNFPCGENKGADQLCSYCTADLRLCFRIFKLLVFPCGGSS